MAFVGQDDPTFVDDVRRELEGLGVRSRVLGVSSLKIAARAPDLTVMFGDAAEDGGVAVLEEVGAERGPFAIIVPHGKLAARLEARQRGVEIVPRKESGGEVAADILRILDKLGEGEAAPATVPVENLLRTAASELAKRTGAPSLAQIKVRPGDEAKARQLLDRFVGDIASLTEAGPGPAQQSAGLEGLDWDDDPETVEKRDAAVAAWRDEQRPKPPRPPNAAARMPGQRSTLPGGISRFPAAAAVLAAAPEEDVTDPQQAPLQIDAVHEAVTRPHELPEVKLALDDATKPAPFPSDDETIDSVASELLAASMNDPDTTSPHRPVALRPPGYGEADADTTSRQEAIAPPPPAPSVPSDPPPPVAQATPPPIPAPAPVAAVAPASAPKKSSSGLGLVLGVAAVVFGLGVVGAGAAWWFLLRPEAAPEGVAAADVPDSIPAASPPGAAVGDTAAVAAAETEAAAETQAAAESAAETAAESESAAEAETAAETAAESLAETAAELDPEAAREASDAHVDEAREHRRNNRLPEARAAFERAIEVHDANPHAHAGLARLALDLGEPELALEHAERAATLRRRRARYQVLLGDARQASGDRPGARRAWERALDMDPDDADARERLGE